MTTMTVTINEYADLTTDDVKNLAQRLEQDDYNNPFEALQDWHHLRAIAFHRQELVEPYLFLLDLESFDEA